MLKKKEGKKKKRETKKQTKTNEVIKIIKKV